MTRVEEILTDKVDRGKGYGMSVYDVSDFDVTNPVLEAMNQFAKEQSIAFGEYVLRQYKAVDEKFIGEQPELFKQAMNAVFNSFLEYQTKDK